VISIFRTTAVLVLLLGGSSRSASAQTLVEASAESRFQLDLRVPQTVLDALVPPGFTMNVTTQGPAKDANLRVVFFDRMTINGPDGRPVGKGSSRLVYLIVPVRDGEGNNSQLVIGGMTADASDAPGPFGSYLPATTHSYRRSTWSSDGKILESQDWTFTAESGEHLEMQITFERGVANRGNPSEVRFYSGRDPSFYQISRQEQVLEILRNVTTHPPDRVTEFSFRGGGGSYARIFDGTEELLSWDNIV